MKRAYPFDPLLKHHFLIALGLAIWIFAFLYFTEPLDVKEFTDPEKLSYLPLYGLAGALSYLVMMPFQFWIYKRNRKQWWVGSELLFIAIFISLSLLISRAVYVIVIMDWNPNMYTLDFFILKIFLPAIAVILPIVLIGRWAFGKYKEKKLEESKIVIEGDGHYEGLRILYNDLICVKADDNYVEVTYLEYGKVKTQLIRTTLTKVLKAHSDLLKTHRSYLVNAYHFQQWKQQSGKLSMLLYTELEVPVSKSFAASVREAIELATK